MTTLSVRIPLAEAKNKLSELIDRVGRGEEITITRHDHEVARLVPTTRPARESIRRSSEAMKRLRQGERATVAEIVAWKKAGRP